MVRPATILVSLATALSGFIIIAVAHSRDTACQLRLGAYVDQSLSVSCQNIVSAYFVGFTLVVGGLLALALALMLMTRREGITKMSAPSTHAPVATRHVI